MTWSWSRVRSSFRERRGISRKYTPPPSVPMQSRSLDLSKRRTVTRVALEQKEEWKCRQIKGLQILIRRIINQQPVWEAGGKKRQSGSTCSSQCLVFLEGCSFPLPAETQLVLSWLHPLLWGPPPPAPTGESCCHPAETAGGPVTEQADQHCRISSPGARGYFLLWQEAHLSWQEVDLCDSGGVFVQPRELNTWSTVAARVPSRKSRSQQTSTVNSNNTSGCHPGEYAFSIFGLDWSILVPFLFGFMTAYLSYLSFPPS